MGLATTPPTVGIQDGPVHIICVNVQWWAHFSGVLSQLTSESAWEGTDDEISDAIEKVSEFLNVGVPSTDCS